MSVCKHHLIHASNMLWCMDIHVKQYSGENKNVNIFVMTTFTLN